MTLQGQTNNKDRNKTTQVKIDLVWTVQALTRPKNTIQDQDCMTIQDCA